MNDDELLHHLARDLDGAFETLVRMHQDRLYGIALRFLGDPRDAEEVAQDTLLRAYRALGAYEPSRIRELRLRAWLATIAIRRCRTHAARRRVATSELVAEGPAAQVARPSETPHEVATRREGATEWAALVTGLPDRYRAAVVLRHVDGLSYPEMSEVLGRPEGTVKAQVHRGLALLRAAFEAVEREESIA
ncbi:MAG TPA: RNA polymerase sigma factor [Candidatus Acidoferrum sp.]|jgi:RNA polymerase sigma-70 factor (ECF subfamily)|nr:RNA polymerase sigma factor [Candidatus Acidoferrum sp.]